MLLGSIFTVFWPKPPPDSVAHAIQHLSAGILLSAIAAELIPTITRANGSMSTVGLVVGFTLGTILMCSLPLLLDEDEGGDGEKKEKSHQAQPTKEERYCELAEVEVIEPSCSTEIPVQPSAQPLTKEEPGLRTLFVRRIVPLKLLFLIKSKSMDLEKTPKHDAGGRGSPASSNDSNCKFPYVFAAAVYVDCFMVLHCYVL